MPRVSGAPLSAVRHLSAVPWAATLLRVVITRDYDLPAILAAIPDATEMEIAPTPLQAAPPRSWEDAGLGAPSPASGSGAALRTAYLEGATDPRAVLERLIARVDSESFGRATYSPFVAADWERARRQADASRARYAEGAPLGPLDGVPVPVKDHLAMAGLPNRAGTSYRNEACTTDSFAVRSLAEAGALLAGKTHTTEWLMNGWGMNHHFDMPRNVWSSEHGAGGSSTGAAVAVALGLAPVSVGSDGGGSIRIPAANNGVFGLKPTFIRISRTGDPLRPCSMCHIGPLGRSTEDLVDLMEAIGTRIDPDDPLTQIAPGGPEVAARWRAALGRGVRGCRLGVLRSELEVAEPAQANACREALAALEAEGAELVDVEIPLAQHALAIGGINLIPEVIAALHRDRVRHGSEFGAELVIGLNVLSRLTLHQFLMMRRARTALREQLRDVLREVDLIVLPTLQGPPISYPLSQGRRDLSDPDANLASTRLTMMSNLTGLPAGSAPIGMHGGFPVNLQVIGDAWDEASVFALMAHLERMGLARLAPCPGFEALA